MPAPRLRAREAAHDGARSPRHPRGSLAQAQLCVRHLRSEPVDGSYFFKKTAEVERQTQYLSRLVNFHVFSTVKSLKTALCYPLQY